MSKRNKMVMRAGYKVYTEYHEKRNPTFVLVYNYEFINKPCEVVNFVVSFVPLKRIHPTALGRWKIKLKY